MKSKLMQIAAGTCLALLVIFGTPQLFVSGQDQENADSKETSVNSRQSIEGVWKTTVTQRNCQTGVPLRTFRALLTFNDGGTLSETAAGSSPSLRGPGHGVWEKVSRTTYSISFVFLRFNADGTFAGTQKTVQTVGIGGRSGETTESTGSVQIFDADDNLLGAGCATSAGTRFE